MISIFYLGVLLITQNYLYIYTITNLVHIIIIHPRITRWLCTPFILNKKLLNVISTRLTGWLTTKFLKHMMFISIWKCKVILRGYSGNKGEPRHSLKNCFFLSHSICLLRWKWHVFYISLFAVYWII